MTHFETWSDIATSFAHVKMTSQYPKNLTWYEVEIHTRDTSCEMKANDEVIDWLT